MQHKGYSIAPLFALGCLACAGPLSAQSPPPDVRPGHWAAAPVQAALQNHILSLQADKNFHGDAKVTHLQAVIALARLGQALESGSWHAAPSVPISAAKTRVPPKEGSWEGRTVTRYVFATALTHMADYANNGIVRAKPTEKETGKSTLIPPPVAVKISKSNPAYDSLNFLASHRMVGPKSALLQADDKPLQAGEMSDALREFVLGLNDRVTDLGHDAEGNTHDEAFHPKTSPKNR